MRFLKEFLRTLVVAVAFVVFVAGVRAAGWLEPSGPPPAGNPDFPINVGATPQDKVAGLSVARGSGITIGFTVEHGNVGVGVLNPDEKLTVVGGKVSVVGTRGSGDATYETLYKLSASDGPIGSIYHRNNGSQSYVGVESFNVGNTQKTPIVFQEYGGNVGIGTTGPTSKLDVAGKVHATDDICTDQVGGVCLGALKTRVDDESVGGGITVGQFYQIHEQHSHTGAGPKTITAMDWQRCAFEQGGGNRLFSGSNTDGPGSCSTYRFRDPESNTDQWQVAAFCAPGQKVISGGGAVYPGSSSEDRTGPLRLSEPITVAGQVMANGGAAPQTSMTTGAAPDLSTEGWRVAAHNSGGYDGVMAYALCAH